MRFQATITAYNDRLTTRLTMDAENIQQAFQMAVEEMGKMPPVDDMRLVQVKELPPKRVKAKVIV